jgi:hypothetical protein
MTFDDRVFMVRLFRLALEFISAMPLDRELGIAYKSSLGIGFIDKTDELLLADKRRT